MAGEFCGASLFRGFPAFQRPTEAREKERHLRNFEIPGYRRGHNIPEASLEPPYGVRVCKRMSGQTTYVRILTYFWRMH